MNARIIGVSTDVANTDRTSAAPARVWLPLAAQTRRLTYVVRSARPGELAPGIRSAIAQTAAAIPIESLLTLDEALRQAASSDYAVIGTLTGFALLALLLAATGLFGVVSYGVAQRTAEFGTRMALGASAGDVVRLVARQSLGLLLRGRRHRADAGRGHRVRDGRRAQRPVAARPGVDWLGDRAVGDGDARGHGVAGVAGVAN